MKELFSILQEIIISVLSVVSFLVIPVMYFICLYNMFYQNVKMVVISLIVMLASIYLNKSLH